MEGKDEDVLLEHETPEDFWGKEMKEGKNEITGDLYRGEWHSLPNIIEMEKRIEKLEKMQIIEKLGWIFIGVISVCLLITIGILLK